MLNHNVDMQIKTPYGITDEFKVKNIVKQGTVNGPILCCTSVGQFSEKCLTNNITANLNDIKIPPIAFVDDITGFPTDISQAIVLTAAETFQKVKILTYNVDKCKVLPINSNYHQKSVYNLSLTNADLSLVDNATYLAEQLNTKGNNDDVIDNRTKKGRSSTAEVIALTELITSRNSKVFMPAVLLLFKSVVCY